MSWLLSRPDLVIIVLYLLGMLGVAVWVSRDARDVEGYTVGNRSVPGWVLGFSVLGTYLSSISFLGLPAKTYAADWNAYVFGLALPPAALVATLYFVPLYRRGNRLSAYELLEERFGYAARCYATLSYAVLQLIRVATVQLLVAFALAPLLDFSSAPLATKIVGIILVSGIAVVIYDTLGGIQAVVWTDVVQVIVLTIGAVWCLAEVGSMLANGSASLTGGVLAGKWSLGPWVATPEESGESWLLANLGQSTVLVMLLYGLSENIRNYGVDQNYVQRMLSAESDGAARRSLWIAAISYIPLSAVFCALGTLLYLHYQQSPGMLPEGARPEMVFPHFIQHELPRPISGLVIAAILAAAMSTIDSSLNSTSTVLFVDVVRRFWKPPWADIWTIRGMTVTLGVLGTGLSIWLYLQLGEERSRTVMDAWWQYAGTAGGGMFGLFLLAWLFPRTPRGLVAVSVIASIPVLAWGTLARNLSEDSAWKTYECPLDPKLVGIAGTLVLLAVALLGRAVWSTDKSRPTH